MQFFYFEGFPNAETKFIEDVRKYSVNRSFYITIVIEKLYKNYKYLDAL